MTDIKRIGVVIADIDEYVHIEKALCEYLVDNKLCGLIGHSATVPTESGSVKLTIICSGIGKVNAAIAATLIAGECDVIVNAGLSGGFGGAKKYDLVIGTKFYEHDFDLTAIGYKPSQKPGQTEALTADSTLVDDIKSKFPIVKLGSFVTGDSFVCEKAKHDALSELFNPIACDMESAAVAEVARKFNKPFVSMRMVSDGADDNSADTYTDTLHCDKADGWFNLLIDWIKSL